MIYKHNGSIITDIGGKWLSHEETPSPTPTPTFDEVTIGTQTWTKYNLNYDDGLGGVHIVNDVVDIHDNHYGTQYYYTWDAAIRIANNIEGWHLPSNNEYMTLIQYNPGFGGDDQWYLLDVIPVGYELYEYGVYHKGDIGDYGYFWSSTVNGSDINRLKVDTNGNSIDLGAVSNPTNNYYSIRLVKDT